MSTMADIIAAHKYDHEGAVCSCSNEVQVGLRCDKQTHAEHVAAELAAAGYGNMADAWSEGHGIGCVDQILTVANGEQYDTPNPYRGAGHE